MSKLTNALNKLKSQTSIPKADVLRGTFTKTNKNMVIRGQKYHMIVDEDSKEYSDDENSTLELFHFSLDLDDQSLPLSDDKLAESAEEEIKVRELITEQGELGKYALPYWNHQRPNQYEDGVPQGIAQRRTSGPVFDGWVMINYQLWKFNIWPAEGNEYMTIAGVPEEKERGRIREYLESQS